MAQGLRSNLTCKAGSLVQNIHPAFRISVAGVKYFPPPPKYDGIEFPERPKLKFVDKVPLLPTNMKAPKMQKRLDLMRGPESVHNFLVHKQYGIIALHGGRLKWGHFEMIRLTLGRKMDVSRMFAMWRVDPPWQPVTKKGQGQRMGGGKGAIDHYVTPVKAGRVIVEMAGICEFEEVRPALEEVAHKLPFAAKVVSHAQLRRDREMEELSKSLNTNPFTFEYLVRNNMAGSKNWISPVDRKWFGKYN